MGIGVNTGEVIAVAHSSDLEALVIDYKGGSASLARALFGDHDAPEVTFLAHGMADFDRYLGTLYAANEVETPSLTRFRNRVAHAFA